MTEDLTDTVTLNYLEEGEYFGEIGMLTNLKRTATIVANEHTTLSGVSREVFNQCAEHFPTIYHGFKDRLTGYNDFNMEFRSRMVRNVPYFRDLSDEIIQKIVYLLRPVQIAAG